MLSGQGERQIELQSGRSTETSYPASGSSSPLKGQGAHRLTSRDGQNVVAYLKNSTHIPVVVQCEGGSPHNIELEYPSDGEGGCLPDHLLGDGQQIYVAFQGACVLLRVQVIGCDPFEVQKGLEFEQRLSGKEVIVSAGEDSNEDERVFFVFATDDRDEVVLISADGTTSSFPATDIDASCTTLGAFHPLPTLTTDPSKIGFVVNCADSAGRALRYIVFYDGYEQEVAHSNSVSEAGGEVRTSGDGAFLSVSLHSDNDVNPLLLYDVANIHRTPASIRFDEPFCTQFLQDGNTTYLVLSRIGHNLQLGNAAVITSSFGAEGWVEIPSTTVTSRYPCPYTEIRDGYLMVFVYNGQTHQFDLCYTKIGSDRVFVVSRVALSPPLLLFADLEPVPDTGATTLPDVTEPSTELTTDVASSDPVTGNLSSSPIPPGAVAVIVVGPILLVAAILLLAVVVVYQWQNKNSCWNTRKEIKPVPEDDREPTPTSVEESAPPVIIVSSSPSTHSLNSYETQTSVNPSPAMGRHMAGNP